MPEMENEARMAPEDTQKDKYLTFPIGSEVYGIAIGRVKEIIGIQPITHIPELPESIKGIINLRGRIIPVMDVRLRFKQPEAAYNDRTCIIVTEAAQQTIGLIVDCVAEVLSISGEDIAPPSGAGARGGRYITGFAKTGDEVKLLLDCDLLFEGPDNSFHGI